MSILLRTRRAKDISGELMASTSSGVSILGSASTTKAKANLPNNPRKTRLLTSGQKEGEKQGRHKETYQVGRFAYPKEVALKLLVPSLSLISL